MSTVIVMMVVLPASAAVWPVVATAAVAAASAMGFAAAQSGVQVTGNASVEVTVDNSEAVTGQLALGEDLVFVRDDIQVVFSRDVEGKVAVMVHGDHHTEDELRVVGEEMSQKLVQQYAYHRVVSELKNRDFTLVDQQVEEDGTVRLHVRTYQQE